MQKARRHTLMDAPTACRQTVSDLFHSPYSEYFSPFPHGTSSLSVIREYLALGDGPPRFIRNFTCSALLGVICTPNNSFHLQDYHLLWYCFPTIFDYKSFKSVSIIRHSTKCPTTIISQRLIAYTILFWAVPCSLATT